jgi:hypothetical protein
MRARFPATIVLVALTAVAILGAQAGQSSSTKTKAKAKTAPSAATITEPAALTCPSVLGTGISTRRVFCDVMAGSDPAAGVLIKIPPHRGVTTLTFDLHNRQTYSEEQVRARRAFARYTATIGVFTLDNTLVTRAAIDSEFRTASDLVDRVGGGAGPGGVKAVAPTGTEPITVELPASADTVSILGEKLEVLKRDGTTERFSAAGRPIALISKVMVEYHPAPPAKPAPKKTIKKK